MRLADLMRRDAGRYDTGVAPLEVDARYLRPKPLEAIVDIPLAPANGGGAVWRGRAGERKPLWAILGEEPPYDWRAPGITERDTGPAPNRVPLASDTGPSDKPGPDPFPGEVADVPVNTRAAVDRAESKPGLYVTGHRTFGIGPVHTAIEYVAEDGTRHWISAGPDFPTGRLVSGIGREDDPDERPTDQPTNNFTVGRITPPQDMTDADYWERIKALDGNFRDNVDYDLKPEWQDGFNSNSYTRGLLDAGGGTYTAPFDNYWGGRSPLPSRHFSPPPLRGMGLPDSLTRQPAPAFRRLP